MNQIFAVHALRELATNEVARDEIAEIAKVGLMYMGAVIVVVLSFPAFQYLA